MFAYTHTLNGNCWLMPKLGANDFDQAECERKPSTRTRQRAMSHMLYALAQHNPHTGQRLLRGLRPSSDVIDEIRSCV